MLPNQITLFGVPSVPTPFPEERLLSLFERLGDAIVADDCEDTDDSVGPSLWVSLRCRFGF